ncbi:hypothetical protein A4X09_0g7512 [Tilletia walkeri]|uniref:Uncharacterized protein n=1 Tax=Tilletia walkeri TaxID=117179 RepID=A0A8X7N0N0_9BASI|nr:hypothetical protein A4X09_0g7512 [Tilletia walkeri]
MNEERVEDGVPSPTEQRLTLGELILANQSPPQTVPQPTHGSHTSHHPGLFLRRTWSSGRRRRRFWWRHTRSSSGCTSSVDPASLSPVTPLPLSHRHFLKSPSSLPQSPVILRTTHTMASIPVLRLNRSNCAPPRGKKAANKPVSAKLPPDPDSKYSSRQPRSHIQGG